jgi:hypothetical protein
MPASDTIPSRAGEETAAGSPVTSSSNPSTAINTPTGGGTSRPAGGNMARGSTASPALPPATLARIYVIGGLVAAVAYMVSDTTRQEFLKRWWWAASIAVVVILGLLFIPAVKKALERATPTKRAVVVFYILIPVLVLLVFVAVFLAPYQANVLRGVFVGIVIFLPATMYYLFIATRKVSLLNEFINNLDRLGLLVLPSNLLGEERDRLRLSRERRFESYRRKFEALYGPVSDQDLRKALWGVSGDAETSMPGIQDSEEAGGLFTSETAVPVVIASILIALGWILLLPLKHGAAMIQDWSNIMQPEMSAVYFAFLGAYFFSLQMLFRRYVLRDLRPSAYVYVAMRTILAVVGTWVVAVLAQYEILKISPHTLVIVGFAIGVFPSLAWQFVQAGLKKITFAGFFIPSLKTQLPISDLDGLTVWHEARLEAEDVENIPNMATADMVDLMLQTRFPPDRIIDWVDQAILYTHIGREETKNGEPSTRRRLREQGIRTATSLVEVYRKARQAGEVAAFEKVLAPNNGGRSPMRGFADAVQTNPNFRIIWVWRGLPDKEYEVVTLPIGDGGNDAKHSGRSEVKDISQPSRRKTALAAKV